MIITHNRKMWKLLPAFPLTAKNSVYTHQVVSLNNFILIWQILYLTVQVTYCNGYSLCMTYHPALGQRLADPNAPDYQNQTLLHNASDIKRHFSGRRVIVRTANIYSDIVPLHTLCIFGIIRN